MSKRRKKNKRKRSAQRDFNTITKPIEKRNIRLLRRKHLKSLRDYTPVIDRRQRYAKDEGPKTVFGTPARIQERTKELKEPSRTRSDLQTRKLRPLAFSRQEFSRPQEAVECRRRRDRREALFARGHAGRGKRIRTPKKFGRFSDISC